MKDFASDAAVLELCTSKSIQKILRNSEIEHEDEGSVMVTLLCMLFLRIFIVTSSSSDVPKKQAMALLWSCLLFFHVHRHGNDNKAECCGFNSANDLPNCTEKGSKTSVINE